MNSKNDKETPGEHKEANRSAISEHSWRVAHIAAILSARLPLHRPPDNSEAWHEGEHSPLDIASPVHDQDFMSCLDRANFLLSNVPGAGAEWVFAEDLFPPRVRLSYQGIADAFSRAGWPKLTNRGTVKTLLGDMHGEVKRELSLRERRRNDARLQFLQELNLELLPAIAPNFQARSIFSLSRELGIKSNRLRIKRAELPHPPPPHVPERNNPKPWIDLFKSHYHNLLGLKSPWRVADVVSLNDSVTVTVEHELRCSAESCDAPCETTGQEETREKSFPLASSYIYLSAKRYPLQCSIHHGQDAPDWPPCCK